MILKLLTNLGRDNLYGVTNILRLNDYSNSCAVIGDRHVVECVGRHSQDKSTAAMN
jgi:hypothetical protein